ncbi:ferredoxin hydrogenase [Clostridium tertium]|jgi:iron-only hydrogenase group A|uniref:Ferredoxin hydrogenase n=1 Tax=Clostridium tertium TaxID=1559 RepID=A0A9X3XGZ5_9CLOT|nr:MULTISPECIES: ferredoxin hydrogenase [Clostridium]MBU6136477.1 [FeFe] hydrogenase, group A [Clostridium tertium]MDB1924127.1 ferredoxin hydrogenase [Clostridium tertium]MDB1927326.1 ferredoxin hydrogenase [Clostridium tertium]MDB1931102.1 ferredoxin hydrogenase [Clostridium tertium]MDB1940523.1 ferredoxin hydrogenase [Clostridium tertium]
MKNITINGNKILVDDNKNLMKIAKENGIDIPALCFLEDCSNVGQCGVCLVEVEGQEDLVKACCFIPEDGMVINTNTERVQEEVKSTVSSLLDKHEFKCGPCKRRENCEFLKLVIKTKARASKPFVVADKSEYVDDRSKSIVLDRTKCVTCGRCVAACKTKTGTESIKFIEVDGQKIVGPENLKCFDDTNCLLCGQCVAACPVDALSEKSHMDRVKDALADQEKHVIVAMAPSVRTAMGELFKMGYGVDVTGKVYTALRELGFDKIFDINFGADMTIMEEATELIQRIKTGGPFPMFTSCCPAWVRQVENYYPNFIEHLSSAKSPQQIFGTASKTYYPQVADVDPKNVFTVTIMPCTAKKYEADRPEMENDGIRNIDAVITTRELAKMIKDAKIDFAKLEDSEADPAMGEYTGAGAIFGATGGVMEAALRTAKDFVEGKDLENIEYEQVRGLAGIKEATVEIGGENYNVAVINGASSLFDFMKSGKVNEKEYHFIEVMACPGGCVNGGGQPHVNASDRLTMDIRSVRASVLYNQDKNVLKKRKSHENGALNKMYETFMGEPGHGKAHELLHIKYSK